MNILQIIATVLAMHGPATIQSNSVQFEGGNASLGARENSNPLGAEQVNHSYSDSLSVK